MLIALQITLDNSNKQQQEMMKTIKEMDQMMKDQLSSHERALERLHEKIDSLSSSSSPSLPSSSLFQSLPSTTITYHSPQSSSSSSSNRDDPSASSSSPPSSS